MIVTLWGAYLRVAQEPLSLGVGTRSIFAVHDDELL